MPNGISKRQQLRNEKTLAELVRTVPGNDRCADCDALSPGWASWNMGLFLCMRCATLHRKLGTHISKVKSLSMDTWSSEQVDSMKSHGNLLMNKIYNPKNVKPPVPSDIDESDSAMERFIRQKYQYRTLADGKPKPPSRDDSYTNRREDSNRDDGNYSRRYEESSRDEFDFGSRRDRSRRNRSPDDSPPPLPPKTGSSGSGAAKFFGFGLRGSASTSNLRRASNKPKQSSYDDDWSPPPPVRKTSGLGAPVIDGTTASFEAKMAAMHDMGFTNDRRNEMVLRGFNEDLDRAVETMTKLGEGSQSSSRSRTPASVNGASIRPMAAVSKPETSNNPFDRTVSNPFPQQAQSTPYNPFDQPTQAPAPTQALENSFQNLQVSQPLFPHSTGGYPQSTMPQAMYQAPFTPPVTATFSQSGYVSSPQPLDNSFNPFFPNSAQPQAQIQPNPAQNNPFFNATQQNPSLQPQQQQQQSAASVFSPPQLQHANTMPAVSSNSPYGTSPFGATQSYQTQPQQQQQQQQQVQNTGQASYNPFMQQSMGQQPPQNQQYQQQQQQLAPQPTGLMNKNSILNLYSLNSTNSPISSIPEQSQSQFQPNMGVSPVPPLSNSMNSTPQSMPGFSLQTPPSNASRNPFGQAPTGAGSGLAAQAGITTFQSPGLGIGMGTNGATTPAMGSNVGMGMPINATGPPQTSSNYARPPHMSQPSMDINGLQSGRHSPDAFASLSARYG
ncbi:hypothetical protein N7495_006780 [Penicillium taxi]|uniref:uncharacterized protein n=1 Tax=Penicillium taxi TaxID=168475 RepID=UPI0025457593|nr:uncharacterized protein N7495_006780 [Penicillium taxi]KAJ5895089.1 hypothetical protein N7495_006780 [Penicillium taxi]